MKWDAFQTHASGKWVLAGEHAVLKGATAVTLPHLDVGLKLSFEPAQVFEKPTNELQPGELQTNELKMDELHVEPSDASQLVHEILSQFLGPVAHGVQSLWPKGRLRIQSTIPIGAGLGSSAALCVALTRWLAAPLKLTRERIADFATELEHRFHGRSSGMDVAVIASGEPIAFVKGQTPRPLYVKRMPRFTLHDTGLRSKTNDCIRQVEAFREESPVLAAEVDASMSVAAQEAIQGLQSDNLNQVKVAMDRARECFYAWKLVPPEAKALEEKLLKEGALSVKLTGAGGGGFLVALW